MKKVLFLLFFLISCSAYLYAQENRFSAAEKQQSSDNTDFNSTQSKTAEDDNDDSNPPNPGDVPIDGGIPVLLLSGILLIGYFRYKTQKH